MTESSGRKNPPEVKDEIDLQFPTETQGSALALNGNDSGSSPQFRDKQQPQPKSFPEWLDLSKLQFGQKLIGWCIFLIVVLSLVDFAWQRANQDENPLAPAIELLKLVTTTALGFVFAKADMRRTPDDE